MTGVRGAQQLFVLVEKPRQAESSLQKSPGPKCRDFSKAWGFSEDG